VKWDLHLHTFNSPDSLSRYEEIIEAVQRRGLDGIAVTDHNTIRGARELAARAPFPVIIAEEIRTTVGEVIGYFLTEEIPKRLPLDETIERIHAQGGVAVVPHPVDRARRSSAIGLSELMRVIDKIDGIEALNARTTFPEDNLQAARIAREHGIPLTAGSDAHAPFEIGGVYTELAPFNGPQEFLAALAQARLVGRESGVWVRFFSTYAWVAGRLGGKN
jgi:predicted metal-dependent phosphoesterase TrpH